MSTTWPTQLSLIIAFFCSMPLASAEVTLSYQQSAGFWGVLGDIENGVNDVPSADSLLNQTYNQPVGAEISLIYRPEEISADQIELREFRIDQVGYAVSSNPVLPQLFGWEGQGLTATVGYRFLDVYGGRFFGKRADAVSTDLIDRKLVTSDPVTLLGAGFHFQIPFEIYVPMSLQVYTRSTDFLSNSVGDTVYNRWQIRLNVPNDYFTGFLILGQNPVPDFDRDGPIWDYLWQIDTFPDVESLIGVGVSSTPLTPFGIQATAGFFGGYFGGRITANPLNRLMVSLQSFGLETTSAYQARQMRLWGAELRYSL